MPVTNMVTPAPVTPARQKAVPSAALLMQAVSLAFDVRLADLHSPVRGRAEVALARQIAMYLARVTLGLTFKGAGNLFNRDRTTAAHACRRVEDLRDDPRIDSMLSVIEAIVENPLAGVPKRPEAHDEIRK